MDGENDGAGVGKNTGNADGAGVGSDVGTVVGKRVGYSRSAVDSTASTPTAHPHSSCSTLSKDPSSTAAASIEVNDDSISLAVA